MIVHLKIELKEDKENIDSILIAFLGKEIVISTTSARIGLTNNYAKDSRDMLKVRVEEYHPGSLLLHVNDVMCSRQDIACEDS